MNVDRTVKNTNMLIWYRELWLIDHGASIYFHHSWVNWEKYALSPFVQIKDHVLLPQASKLEETDMQFKTILTSEKIREIVNLIPDEWLDWEKSGETIDEIRETYFNFLETRKNNSNIFVKEAQDARKTLI